MRKVTIIDDKQVQKKNGEYRRKQKNATIGTSILKY